MSITIEHTKEQLTYSHVYALAGMARVNLTLGSCHDYGVDGSFDPVIERHNRLAQTGVGIQFQAKATENWFMRDGHIVYDLASKNYNDMVTRGPEETTLMLVLLVLPQDSSPWHETTDDDTTLRRCCYWYVPSGPPRLNESSTVRIEIPLGNVLTPDVLNALIEEEKARRRGA